MRNLAILASALALTGCANLPFYVQAARGQLDLNKRRVPVAEVIADPATGEKLRRRLEVASMARDFAVSELGLPDNGSYRTYADLERPYVTWNVFAAPEFSVSPKTWCYPVTGCVSYRGYFREHAAVKHAARIASDGLDTYVGGVPAYSTLGRLKDPIVSSMLGSSDNRLVATMFHELAHQQIYVKGDSAFNESFATAVANEGLRRWVLETRQDASVLDDWRKQAARHRDFVALVQETRESLADVYESGIAPEKMRAEKAAMLDQMKRRYEELKSAWSGYSGYDGWFEKGVNNAKLGSVGTYQDWVPAFGVLLEDNDGSLADFYAAVADLGELKRDARDKALRTLVNRSK